MKLEKTKINNLNFWYWSDDKVIGQRIALNKYEKYETAMILSQINEKSVVVDVGANIGYYTILTAKIAKKVYAFEPEKRAFEILQRNVRQNKLKNVVLINKAVGSENKKVRIKKNKNNFGDSRVVTGKDIDCIKLDNLIREKIDVVKIDVQGYEFEVWKGMTKIVKKDKPVIFMEIDRKNIPKIKTDYKFIWSINDFAEVPWPIYKGVKILGKAGYADLWMKNKMSSGDYLAILKNINYKKWIKGIINSIWQK